MRPLSSWGCITADQHQVIELADRLSTQHTIQVFKPGIAHGMGRSYGDVCLNAKGVAWQTRHLDHFIAFDPAAGVIRCESGVLLASIQKLVTKSGWMLPVTPGTQQVTVGGAIANDVHGKNHHILGTFGHHIESLTLARTDGEIIVCGPDNRAEWFNATVGGLGLTGVILEASIRLRPIQGEWLDVETLPFQNLDEFFSLSAQSEVDWEYTVAWVDCLSAKSRGVFMRGNHSPSAHAELTHKSATRNIPFSPPFSLVNGLSLRAFNQVYYASHQLKQGRSIIHYEPFFYPLDGIRGWNKLYGAGGFYQYQCVVPMEGGRQVIKEILATIANKKMGSFLAVLKVFGDKAPAGLLSFPMHGITLALDFPNQGKRTQLLFATLDELVSAAGGRIYCAKDASMSPAVFAQGYPALTKFKNYRDPGISSSLSRRLFGI
jgi:FAD/FMN-containing dehydrogenase